ncbi:MAG: hypothetical protein SFW67_06515 [Myxococcaceae bacterium]|nr:hypothetical protein [Myxococcaceae bacterium]
MLAPLLTLLLAQAPMTPLTTSQALEAQLAKGHDSKASVVGTLERVTMGKGRKTWQGTALVLDDDGVVWLTYGAPPPGFDAFLGQHVRVEGTLSKARSTTEQSLIAPHLLSPSVPVAEPRALGDLLGRRVRLVGQAADAKGGAVLLVGEQPIYVMGKASWPEALLNQRVALGGRLVRKQHLPLARRSPDGAMSQGAVGEQLVLEDPTTPASF